MYITIGNKNKEFIEEEILSKKYIPCTCSIKWDLFEISFHEYHLKDLILEVKDFDIRQLGVYLPLGAGGEWYAITSSLITIKKPENSATDLIIHDLGLYDHHVGWHWMYFGGVLTDDYCWDGIETRVDDGLIKTFPLKL